MNASYKMNKPLHHTAILVFSLSAHKERKANNILGIHQRTKGKKALDLLIKNTKRVVDKCGVDVVWITEKDQIGETFGERFSNAFLQVFAMGYEEVISIGNDCPDLTTAHINSAITMLHRQNLILGPSFDGGDYLIGIQKANFDASLFKILPWNTNNLHDAMIALANKLGLEVTCLQTLMDIDNSQAIKSYLKINLSSDFANSLKQLFCWFEGFPKSVNEKIISLIYSISLFQRPPPYIWLNR